MRTLWLAAECIFLLIYFTLVFGQYDDLPNHYPRYPGSYATNLQTSRHVNSGVKTSGTKTHTKTFTKTGSSHSSSNYYDARNSRSSLQHSCVTNPRPPMNSNIRCNNLGCNATCLFGYRFSDGQTRISITCKDTSWVVEKPNWVGVSVGDFYDIIPVACEPVCEPPCENNGICYEPNRCNCAENFSGIRCENSRRPCLNHPPLPMNARRTCSTTQCTVTCLKGHTFPDGSAITTLKCIQGSWLTNRDDWKYVPDCQPTCNPTCQNGGNCLSLNICQCPQEFRGPQCQYRADACSVKRLGFNGGFNCSGNQEIFKCSIICPTGIDFEFTPAQIYSCKYSTGYFEPQPVPQCIYNSNVNIFMTDTKSNYSHKVGSYSRIKNSEKWELSNAHTRNDIGSDIKTSAHSGNLIAIEEHLPVPGICYFWSGNHFRTFDGAMFSATSNCAHTLLRDSKDDTFSIIISQNANCRMNESCPRIISIYLQDKEYTLTMSDTDIPTLFGPGNKRLPLPGQVPGLRGFLEAHHVVIILDNLGVTLKWDTQNLIEVNVRESLWNRTEGLCGILDGDISNDLFGRNGKKQKTVAALMDSWRLNIIEDICTKPIRDTHSCSTVSKTLASRAYAFCSQILTDKKLSMCKSTGIDISEFLEACQWDYCACYDSADPTVCACRTVEVYIKECCQKINTNEILRWRDDQTCPMKCSGGRIYTPCAFNKTPLTCASSSEDFLYLDKKDPDEPCIEGCFCPSGTVSHSGQCISPETCPCLLRRREFSPGAQVPKECNTCTCEAGHWKCTEIECGARCSAIGDPHYQTFDGKKFDFMGQCAYYLVRSSNFSIEADNVACAGSISYAMNFPINMAAGLPSCTRSVTIRTTSGHTIKLKQNQEVLVDGQDVLRLPHTVGDTDEIRIASSLFTVVELGNGIEIWWDGVTRVYIDAPASFRDKTKGLCGTFNSNQKDDFLSPEGDVETDVMDFANKWKVDENCDDVKQDQHSRDHPCEVNIHNKEKAKKFCQAIHSKIFSKCHWLVNPEEYYEDCLFDMCSCEGKISDCLCSTLAAYGSSCAALGAGVNWRADVRECGISCPNGQIYQHCSNPCTRSCYDISTRPNCKSACIEGCNCPEGQALDEKNNCVPIDQCNCQSDGIIFPAGYKELRDAALSQETCVCSNGAWVCQPATSSETQILPKYNDRQTICSLTKNQEFTTCEPSVPITCKNMHDQDLFAFSTAVCRPGCKCKTGFVLKEALGGSGLCIRPSECPCHHGGKSFKENETLKIDCNNCTCENGAWKCTETTCAGICTSWGDSHFTTFDGKDFDYQGQCNYILAKGSLGKHDNFVITIQNIPCGTLGVSCSKSVTIAIAGESFTLVKDELLPNYKLLQRMSLRQTDLFVIIEAADLGLTMTWDKGTRVIVRVSPTWRGRLKGLCGNYNDNQNDDFQTPSGGFSEISPSVFGDSWQIGDSCPPGSEVQDTCELRPERRSWAVEKCSVLKSGIFSPCHNEVPVERFLERCIFDSCACDKGGDCDCLCTALAAYAYECNGKGVHIKWRSQHLCPLQCDERCSNYSPCISTCPIETCDNIVSHSFLGQLCKEEICIEGCVPHSCPPDQIYMNASAIQCVPRSTCKPICMELDGKIFSEGELIEEDDCQKCFCSKNKKICSGKPCQKSFSTQEPNDNIVECKSGWSEWINQDVSKDKYEFRNGKKYDIEPIPTNILLHSMQNGGRCQPEMMTDIQCRTVTGKIDPKATPLDVECSLERGLICKSDKKNSLKCPDFEIRVLCDCEPSIAIPTSASYFQKCNISTPHQQHELNCHLFYHCVPSGTGFILVEKTCGPSMWFNPQNQICDFPSSVQNIRPECKDLEINVNKNPPKQNSRIPDGDLGEQLSEDNTICPPGFTYSDCATECHRLCSFYSHVVRTRGHCLTESVCEAGCMKKGRELACPPGFLWRDNTTCVGSDDCICRAHDGTPVKPGTVHKESDCEVCQCISNHYVCDRSSCTTTTHPTTQAEIMPSGTIEPFTGFITLRPSETPPEQCPKERYSSLLSPKAEWPISDAAFTASSIRSEAYQPWHARIGTQLPITSAGSWTPYENNQDQYIQVNLGRIEPIYGVILLGDPFYDNFVTSFQLLYSSESTPTHFRYAITKSGLPQLLRGGLDQRTPAKAFLDIPVEARYLRINPKTWHNEISIRFDIIGCNDIHTSTASIASSTSKPQFEIDMLPDSTLEPRVLCDEPMGVDNELLNPSQITVSSEKVPGLKYHGLRLSETAIWQPLANTPNEYIKFNFESPKQLTGLKMHGGPQGWVSAFKIYYSHDDKNWNLVLDEFGEDKLFLGNFDQDTIHKSDFSRPIRAQFLKITPKKWTSNIQMAVEPLGCFEPYPIHLSTVLPEVEYPVKNCSMCPDIPYGTLTTSLCQCSPPLFFNSTACVPRVSCPCVSSPSNTLYTVGSVYEASDCSTCLCALGGVAQCSRKRCEPCEAGLKSEITPTCGCTCKACSKNEVLCSSSNICIEKQKWCDGIVDCPDDEISCISGTTIEPILTTQKSAQLQCPPVACPPGFKITLKRPSVDDDIQKNLSPMFHMYGGRKSKISTEQISARYYGSKGRRITGRNSYQGSKKLPRRPLNETHTTKKSARQQVCVEFICEPPKETLELCSEPACPLGYSVVYSDTESQNTETFDEKQCKTYECHPPPVRDDICNVTGRSINTFDGMEFKYDICYHTIARDLHSEDWDINLIRNCSSICSRDLIIRHGSELVRMFSDLSMKYNGYRYTAEQTSKIGSKNLAFVVSRMGDTLLFVSNHYGFWIMWNKQANLKLGVSEKLMGQVDGLCGFYDRNSKNDKRKPDGRQAKTSAAFGDSWLLEDEKPEICEAQTCPLHVQNSAFKMCQGIKERILAPCLHAIEDIDGWISRCLETTCLCLEQTRQKNETEQEEERCRCDVLESFVVECTTARPSVELEDWRMHLGCPASCNAPLVHHDCYRRRCEPSCSNLAEVDSCPTLPNLCFPGCYCPAGLVKKKNRCVAPKECRDCECNVLPHLQYVTYDGFNHTANTNCTYIMSRSKARNDNGRDFELYITNGPCPLNPGKMCTSVLNLMVNGHRIEVHRGISNEVDHEVLIDDFSLDSLPFNNGWVEVTRLPARHINILISKLQVELRAYFPTLGASLRVPSHGYGGELEGICGNCDRNPDNDNLGPANSPIFDEHDFITAWQTDSLATNSTNLCSELRSEECTGIKGPDGQDPCLILLDADRFGQCHLLLDPQIFLSTCYHDTCGGHLDAACSSLETYALGCRAQGLCIDYHTDLCPPKACPGSAEYALCGAPCIKTCDNLEECTEGFPKEGCFCPQGLVLKNNTQCVEKRECFPCDDLKHYPGDSWSVDACTKCTCEAVSRTIRCETHSCPTVDTLCEEGLEPIKIKKSENECCHKFACVPVNMSDVVCEEPKPPLCGEDQIRRLERRPDGCLDFVCQCKPPSECPVLAEFTDPLPLGMERVINDSGCCPRENLVCKMDKCQRPPSCPKFHYPEEQTMTEHRCCPEYECVGPSDKCLFTKSYTAADAGGERALTVLEQEVILLDGNQTVVDGPCRLCKCEKLASSSFTTSCIVTECPALQESSAAEEYVLEPIWTRGQCCPIPRKTACKSGNEVRNPGEKWHLDHIKSPCILLECVPGTTPDSDVSLTRHVVTCDIKCQLGSEYQPPKLGSGECCGVCKQMACVVDGQIKGIGTQWTSPDFCTEFKCLERNETIFVSKKEIMCPKPAEDMYDEFVYEFHPTEGTCCGRHEPVACLVDKQPRSIGSSWPDPNGDPCVTITCLHSGSAGGELIQQRTVESCSKECHPGWKYTPSGSTDICCGECTQVSCISNGTLHLPGDTWVSSDGCTKYECTRQNDGTLTTSLYQETCPDTSECAKENLWMDGCCQRCNLTSGSMTSSCEPIPIPPENTIGLVVQLLSDHGRCRNIDPLKNFTECRGHCQSGTFFNQETSAHASSCNCCQAVKYTVIPTKLICIDGHEFKREIAVPSGCSCEVCA